MAFLGAVYMKRAIPVNRAGPPSRISFHPRLYEVFLSRLTGLEIVWLHNVQITIHNKYNRQLMQYNKYNTIETIQLIRYNTIQ